MGEAVFIIRNSDDTEFIDLLSPPYGIVQWIPSVPGIKNDGVWQSSPYADGRRLAFYRYDNVTEQMGISISSRNGTDGVIDAVRRLRSILEKARDYWVSPIYSIPIFIEARGDGETNTRYAVVIDYRLPYDNDPYGSPMREFAGISSMVNLPLVIEHGPWQDEIPGTDTNVEISQYVPSVVGETNEGFFLWTRYQYGDPTTTYSIQINAEALYNDLMNATDFTIDIWVDVTSDGPVLAKSNGTAGGWYIRVNADQTITFFVDWNTTDEISTSSTTIPLNEPVLITVEHTLSTKTAKIYINGVEVSYSLQQAGSGTIVTDASYDLTFGVYFVDPSDYLDGYWGPLRMCKEIIYGSNFTPAPVTQVFTSTSNVFLITAGGAAIKFGQTSSMAGDITHMQTIPPDVEKVLFGPYEYGTDSGTERPYIFLPNVSPAPRNPDSQALIPFYYDASEGEYIMLFVAVGETINLPTWGTGDYIYLMSTYPLHTFMWPGLSGLEITDMEFWNGSTWETVGIWAASQQPFEHPDIFVFQRAKVFTSEATQTILPYYGNKYYYRIEFTHTNGSVSKNGYKPNVIVPLIKGSLLKGDLPALARYVISTFFPYDDGVKIDKLILATRSASRGLYCAAWRDVKIYGEDADAYYFNKIVTRTIAADPAVSFVWGDQEGTFRGNGTQGTYRMFLRAWQSTGAYGDVYLQRIAMSLNYLTEPWWEGELFLPYSATPAYSCLDLGSVTIKDDMFYSATFTNRCYLWFGNKNASSRDISFVDLVLMPSDEMYIEIDASDVGGYGNFDINTTQSPKRPRSAYAETDYKPATPLPFSPLYRPQFSAVGIPELPVTTDSYLYMLILNDVANTSRGTQGAFVEVKAIQRYLSMRGNS